MASLPQDTLGVLLLLLPLCLSRPHTKAFQSSSGHTRGRGQEPRGSLGTAGTGRRGRVSGKCPAPGERGRKSPSTKCWRPSWGRAARDQRGHQHHVPAPWPGDAAGTEVGNACWGHADPVPLTACTLPAPAGAAPRGERRSPASQTPCGHRTARGERHQHPADASDPGWTDGRTEQP